ncbi:hypothetical protein Goari_011934, partial [Gossypium aridum]|nr:hypothetical protein [Gossypium aridum]
MKSMSGVVIRNHETDVEARVAVHKLTNRTPDRSSIRPTITDGKEPAVAFSDITKELISSSRRRAVLWAILILLLWHFDVSFSEKCLCSSFPRFKWLAFS